MAAYNRIVMVGNLTRDPEYKQLASGQSVCRLGLATNRQFKNRQTGAMIQEVCYVDIDVWGAQAESCNQYLKKGRSILVEGRLKFDTWQDQTGNTRSKHCIVADRVVFLAASAQTDETATVKAATLSDNAGVPKAQQDKVEKELLNQIDQIKQKQTKPKAAPAKEKVPNTGEVAFQDQPPFEDDLPF